jgi:hypothetical protein
MLIYQQTISRTDTRNNRGVTYIYGDNDTRSGSGGQAASMRGEPNTIGIRTKKKPSMNDDAFYSDDEYEANCAKIEEDFAKVQGVIVIMSSAGLGTGLSDMKRRCPRTFAFLNEKIREL